MHDPERTLCAVCIAPTIKRRCRICDATCQRRAWPGCICERCELHRQVDELRSAATHEAAEQLEPFLAELRATDNPGAPLAWLANSPAATTLRLMLAGDLEISHDILDARGSRQATGYFRARLVNLAVLPARDEHLARFDKWCDREFATQPTGSDRQHLAQYARWHVRPALARRAGTDTALPSTYRYARQKVRTASALLRAVHGAGHELNALTQDTLDDWLAGAASRAVATRAFVNWAHEQHIIASLEVRRPAPRTSTTAIDHAERIAHARRLINDTTIPLTTRAAGLLLLLYGQHVTRIVTLGTTHVEHRANGTYLTLGAEPVKLPDPVAAIVAELHSNCSGPWLFPGAKAGAPIHAASMCRRLRAATGMNTSAARTGALLSLAAEVPGPVLAELLGYCNDTASHWRREASGDWARYASLAARTSGDPGAERR